MAEDMINTTVYRFRTSVGGFHKGDVADYIAKTAQQHQAELAKKDSQIAQQEKEIQSLREQLNLMMASSMLLQEDAPSEPDSQPALTELELEAYRRAEAAERLANQRAKKLYVQMEDICRSTDAAFDGAKTVVEETAQQVLMQAQVLNNACQTLTQALHASRDTLSVMDAMLPEPAELLEEAYE